MKRRSEEQGARAPALDAACARSSVASTKRCRLKPAGPCTTTRGFVTTEYLVVTAAMILALFMPVGESTAGATAIDYVLTSLREFQDHTMYLLSLP